MYSWVEQRNVTIKMASDSGCDFDVRQVSKYFKESYRENGHVSMREYIEGYREWCKFFKFFGTVFSFVTSDVVAKLQTLEEYLNSEEGEHYETIHSMVEYELGSNPNLRTSGKKEATGARTLLRLHRALNFCSKLSEGVANVKMDEKMSTMAWDVYNEALAPYHMWLIRKGVGVAMYALPTKQNLYEKSGLTSEEEGNQLMLEAAKSMEPVYNSVQKLYEEHDLLELP